MAERKTYTVEQKLAWGKEAVENNMSRKAAAEKFGLAESQLDAYRMMYHIEQDTVPAHIDTESAMYIKATRQLGRIPKRSGGKRKSTISTDEARAKDAERHRLRRLAAREANGTGTNLVVANGHDLTKYTARITELEGELEHALEHCDTLQKILMAVGKQL